jgi:hypothetical protein
MTPVKLVVIYPHPKDIDAFEKVYQNEHIPLAVAKLEGKAKVVPEGTCFAARYRSFYASQKFIFG